MELQTYRTRLHCSVPQVDDIFAGCMAEARSVFSEAGLNVYLDGASAICNLGRGQELVLIFLEGMPGVARIAGEELLPEVVETARLLSRGGSARAINPFLATLPSCTRRLEEGELVHDYLLLIQRMAELAGEGLVPLLRHVEHLLGQLPIGGLKNWIEFGIHGYRHQPWRFADYFSLQTADSRAVLQRERHGTLYADYERRLAQYLQGLWSLDTELHPYSLAFDTLRKPVPHIDERGFHLPDVYDDLAGVRGIDRYRALLAHLAAHLTWTKPFIADNFNRYQQMAIETFEDARVEWLAMQRYPGLRGIWQRLHPVPREGDCPEGWSCIRHKLAMLSRALLDPTHGYTDPKLLDSVARFHARMAQDPHDPKASTELGVKWVVANHEVSFRSPKVFFEDTEVGYRDDNRYLWIFLEDTDEEDDFHSHHAAANPKLDDEEEQPLFVRHLREWDYTEQRHHPDWVTVYEAIQPAGDAACIDQLLEEHKPLAKQLRRIVDLLKPQQQVRIRYQEEGDELDLDIALRAMVDYRSGITPDPRIHSSHRTDGRDISVLLLLDLSQSINEIPQGCDRTILQLSQEAVALLAWAVDALGDPFAIAGFASNTRHEVRYLHFKGFNEPWGVEPKARLAAMEGGLSTRMGAALRTAGHYLSRRTSERKLLLILTDGEPSDIDVDDVEYLRHDAKQAVDEIASEGVSTYCISLDPHADDYVANIFGPSGYAVIDRIERLPERLPKLFMSLTK